MGGLKFKYFSIWSIFLIISIVILRPLFVGATSSQDTFWSWTDEEPKLLYSKLIDEINYDNCPTIIRTIKVAGEGEEYRSCVYGDEATSFAVYWPSNFSFAVKLPNDSKMHKFHSECGMYNPCIYLPNTDTLVMKRSVGNGGIGLLLIYKNFTKRLMPIQNGLIREYNFDNSEPDYTSHFPDGDYWLVNGLSASDNGEWLAVEILSRGFALINIKTLQTKQIDNQYFRYWVGMNPTPELAISNDGRHLAITGINAGFRIVDIDNNCGVEMSRHNISKIPILNPCKDSQINISLAIDWFRFGYKPRFSDDGGELTFYAESNLFEKREIVFRASQYQTKILQYLALGDSFTSGEGELEDKYYLPRTNDKFEKCHLSTRSYPFLLSKLYNFDSSLSKSVACSGATTSDINGNQLSYKGQGNRLGSGTGNMNLNNSEMLLAANQAKQDFIPGRVRQADFVEKYKPNLITIGIGGNDAGLMNKLATCASPGTCEWVSDKIKKAQTANEISSLFDKLVKTYQDVSNKSTNSKIYAIGYPRIINPSGDCSATINAMFTDDEKTFMDESILYLNQVIYNATKRAGIGYIDIENGLGGQALCGDKKPLAVNGVQFGDDSKIARVVGIGNETFHPNYLGHKLVADILKNKIGDNYCQNTKMFCPDENVKNPVAAPYWGIDSQKIYPKQRNASFLRQSDDQNKLIANLEPHSLEPNSEIKVEIQSEPAVVGIIKADEDGSLNSEIQLPDNLDYGYYTIYLYGKSYSGEDVELYQIVRHSNTTADNDSARPIKGSEVYASPSRIVAKNNSYENVNQRIEDSKETEAAVLGDEKTALFENKAIPLNKNSTPTLAVLAILLSISSSMALYFIKKRCS